ncbi:DUF4251 domain-containing protein [soil metagenome]
MKRLIIYILVLIFIFSAGIGMAQAGEKEDRKVKRAEKMRLKEEEANLNQEKFLSLVNDQDFVLETYALFGRYNSRIGVSPNTNFISIHGDQLTLQTGNGITHGYNGVGGITINGRITNYKVKTSKNNKNLSVMVQYTSPALGHSTLNLNIQSNGSARAFVTDNWGGRATFQGEIVSPENARIYKGLALPI